MSARAKVNQAHADIHNDSGIMSRAKETIEKSVIMKILRESVPHINDSRLHLDDDHEVIVANYLEFFQHVAEHTNRLRPETVKQAALMVYEIDHAKAKQFGNGIASAFSYCMAKGRQSTSQKKLSSALQLVLQSSAKFGSPAKASKTAGEAATPSTPKVSPPSRSTKRFVLSPRSSIFAMYGCSPPIKKKVKSFAESRESSQVILSSQEDAIALSSDGDDVTELSSAYLCI